MAGKLSKNMRRLEEFLLSDAVSEDAMLLSELDGFLAGIIVCPDLVMPSEWLPKVWKGEEPVFDTERQAEDVTRLIMGRYNEVIRQLDGLRYRPIFEFDPVDDVMWELWMDGFAQAVSLRPQAWETFIDARELHVREAMFVLGRLTELATSSPAEIKPMDIDDELESSAPNLIPPHVEILHQARKGNSAPLAGAPAEGYPRVGRNDPCPCGSGKKYKKCCLN